MVQQNRADAVDADNICTCTNNHILSVFIPRN
jgi:hypothetical protein